MIASNAIVIRHAGSDDADVLERLAVLDSRPALDGPALLAEVDGVARAALALDGGEVVADPFAPTADLVALLRLRARRLAAAHPPPRTARERVGALVRRPRGTLTARA
ncbi:MAG: hypothetical protein LC713_01915 [Actinobacteria bacterium]|nr:hypothetical protein [Actinomycetota bacterium]